MATLHGGTSGRGEDDPPFVSHLGEHYRSMDGVISNGNLLRGGRGYHMGPHFKFPPASLSVFELVNVLLILPLYDRFLVPFLRRFTGHSQGITHLQRIGTGIVFSILAMLIAGFVEVLPLTIPQSHSDIRWI